MGTTHRYIRLLPIIAVLALLSGMFSASAVRAAGGTVSPEQGSVGTRFHFNADGFWPGERVDSWVTRPDGSTAPRYPSVYADANGAIVWSWDVDPGTPSGVWDMTARGIDSDVRVVIAFTVVDSPPVTLPNNVSPASGIPGTTFTFSVGDMIPGERVSAWLTQPDGASRDFEPNKEFRVYADENGSLSWTWTSPSEGPVGTWIASVRGADSSKQVDISFQITGNDPTGPVRSITPTSGAPGTTFTVAVGGFGAKEKVGSWFTLPDGSSITAVPYMLADSDGVATWTWTVPTDAPSGTWQAVTKGDFSGLQVTLPFTITGNNPMPAAPTGPTITLSPTTVDPGGTLTVLASGFASGEELNYWPNSPDGLPVENRIMTYADKDGNATWNYKVPNNAVTGVWTFNVQGDDSDQIAQASFTVTNVNGSANYSVYPSTGGPGTTFQFIAGGFRDKPEKVYFWFHDPNGNEVTGPDWKRNDHDGRVSWEWTAPEDAMEGTWEAVAHGEKSHIEQVIPFTIERDTPLVPPSASVSPETGGPGTAFTFTANGFKDGERVGYWLNLPDGTVVRFDHELTGDDNGSVTVTWTAPADAQRGLYIMAIKSSQSDNVKGRDISYEVRFTVQ
ncbi:MAG: hypothetical protein HGA19_06835 [Oscillochloris sp.]|nr:hypothetical protein [Oscillochloris sp.]